MDMEVRLLEADMLLRSQQCRRIMDELWEKLWICKATAGDPVPADELQSVRVIGYSYAYGLGRRAY